MSKRFAVHITMRSGKIVEMLTDACADTVTAQSVLDDVLKPVETLKGDWLRNGTQAVQIEHVETIEIWELPATAADVEPPVNGIGGADDAQQP